MHRHHNELRGILRAKKMQSDIMPTVDATGTKNNHRRPCGRPYLPDKITNDDLQLIRLSRPGDELDCLHAFVGVHC